MIEVKQLNMEFEEGIVLENINARFEKGLVNMIIGKSGSGKTVLLKCIVGLLTPTSGEILYNGRDFLKLKTRDLRRLRRDIGMLFQGSALFDSRTVLENVMFPLDMNSVINIGDKVIFINEGIKEWEGSKSEVMGADNEKLNDFVFASDLFKKIKKAEDIISEDKKG